MLIERLRWWANWFCKDRDAEASAAFSEAATALEAYEAEIARLTGLVKTAYVEGHQTGRSNPPVYQHYSEDWPQSRSFKALSQSIQGEGQG